jgi:hypothetical protein
MLTITLLFKDGEDLVLKSDRPPWRWAEYLCVKDAEAEDDVVYHPNDSILSITVKGANGQPQAYRAAA